MVASPNPLSLARIFIQTKELAEFNHGTARDQQQKKKKKNPETNPTKAGLIRSACSQQLGKAEILSAHSAGGFDFFFLNVF